MISLLQFDLFFPGLQLLVKVGNAGNTPAIDISLRHPQLRIALKTDPIVPRVSPDPFIKKDFFHSNFLNGFIFCLDTPGKLS
jgi:hypothetical protein